MAINIDYGSISAALRLADIAGQGQGAFQGQQAGWKQADVQTQQQQAALDEQNKVNANQIQEALQGTQQKNQQQYQNQELQVRSAANQQEAAYRNQEALVAQQNAASRNQQVQQTGQYQQGRLGISQQRADDAENQPDSAPPQNTDIKAAGMLSNQLKVVDGLMKDSAYDPSDILSKPSLKTPGAKEGKDDTYTQTKAIRDQLAQKLQEVTTRLSSPAPSAQPVQQPAAAGPNVAQGGAPNITKTATNSVGHKVGFDANTGQWVPLPG